MKAAGRNRCVGIACTPRIALNPVSWLEIPYSILISLFYRVARSYSTLLPILTSFFVMNGKHYLPLRTLFTPSASLSLSPMNPSSSDSSKQSDILHSHEFCNANGTQILDPPPIM